MILVTGGTGFVGKEVVKELLALGYCVRLLIRHPENANANAFASHPRIEWVKGDALQPETLRPALIGIQTVIHLIGIIAETSHVTFEQAHIEATRNVLAAAQEAGVTRWIQMSALGTRPHARSRYHLTKWQAEELVRQSGLDWTILRPSLIYGYDEHDRLLNLFRLLLSWPLNTLQLYSFALLDGGRPLIQPISVREVAHCFAQAPAQEASVRRTYDLVGPIAFTWREMICKILIALEKESIHEEIPLLLILRALLWLTAFLLLPGILWGLSWNMIDPPTAELGIGLWFVLLLLICRWRTVIIFSVPSAPLLVCSEALNAFAPRSLQVSEVLKMAMENNAGDPHPAVETFTYVPESFEQGLAKCFKK